VSLISVSNEPHDAEFYRLEDSVGAIAHDVSGEKRGVFVRIPAGSVLQLQGDAPESNMVQVVWRGRRFLLFGIDLAERASRFDS
jgi:hypothetical protein